MRHGATGIAGGDIAKALVGFVVGEGVQKRDGTIECDHHRRRATHFKMRGAQMLRGGVVMLFLRAHRLSQSEGDPNRRHVLFHLSPSSAVPAR